MGFSPDEEVVRPEGSVSPAAQEASSNMDKIITRVQEAQAFSSTEALSASRESAAARAKDKELALEAKSEVTRQHPKYSEFAEALKSPRYKKILENPDKEKEAFYLWLENMGYNQ